MVSHVKDTDKFTLHEFRCALSGSIFTAFWTYTFSVCQHKSRFLSLQQKYISLCISNMLHCLANVVQTGVFIFFFLQPRNKESICPDLSFFRPGWEERSAMYLTLHCSVNATTCTRVIIFKSTKNTVCVAAVVHQIINLLINLLILAAAAAAASDRWLMGFD